MNKFILTISAALLCAAATTLPAAEIRREPLPEMQCTHSLTGQIAPGDADALQAALEDWDGGNGDTYQSFRLCLDSPGGALLEALKIADLGWDFGTAVGPEARCLSACAMIFMAGSRSLEGGIGLVPDRFLHASGDLGFHAPSLVVAQGSYNEATVRKAYSVAVQGIAEITERTGLLQMSLANLSTMLSTPPETFYRINSPRTAAAWKVRVTGVDAPETLSALHMTNACMAVTGRSPQDGNAWARVSETNGYAQGVASFGHFDSEPERCDISFRRDHDPFDLVDYDVAQYGTPLVPAMFYPPDTPLRQLAADPTSVALAPAPTVETYKAQCHVYSGGRLTDSDPCTQTDTSSITTGGRNHLATGFKWPSGAVTVLETVSDGSDADDSPCCGRRYLLNGKAAEQLYDFDAYEGYGSCYRSSATGNVFCAETQY